MRVSGLPLLGLLLIGCTVPLVRPIVEYHQTRRLIARAEEMVQAGDYRGAQAAYRKVLEDYPEPPFADHALFGLARLFVAAENPDRNYRLAYQHFGRLLTDYPESRWAREARAWREVLATLLTQREEAERARQEAHRLQQDLERLKQLELELEGHRRR